jgi:hypothetical protein
VEEVLQSRHPETRKPGEDAIHQYEDLPKLLDLDHNKKTDEKVARKLSSGAGLKGINSTFLK